MLEDQQLLHRLKQGDADALRQIYVKYKDTMYTVALSLLNEKAAAEDVLHDIFVRFAGNAPRFNHLGSLKSYLITCVVNRCRDMLRSKMYRVVEVERAKDKPSDESDPSKRAIADEHSQLMHDALAKVPQPQREVLVLRTQGGLKFKEIADMQAESINTIQGRYRYGLEKMRAVLNGQIDQ